MGNSPAATKQEMDLLKAKTARLSVISNASLVVMKFIVGFAVGSVSIISEAIHSSMDLLAAGIAFISVRKAAEPPDEAHTFGHGKFEDMSGLIEAVLIFVAAALIIYEAVQKLLGHGEDTLSMNLLYIGMAVMGISALANWLVSRQLMKVAKETESIALESDAWHLRTDVYTSLGVLVGLVLIRITGITMLDSIIAIGVACIIIKAAYELTVRSFSDLTDKSLPQSQQDRIIEIICDHASDYAGFHGLKTRRSGPEIFIDFHLVMPAKVTVEESHDFMDHLEIDLRTEFPRATINIHTEPCTESCNRCGSFCTRLKEKNKPNGN